jgi:Domain of unknown function (DUF4389)
MSQAAVAGAPAHHPIGLIVTDDLHRSRLTVFFRILLAIPQFIWLTLWSIAAGIVILIAWFAALFMGRLPDGLHNFLAAFLRYYAHVNAYVLLLANPWPPFLGNVEYPIDARIDPPARQNRWTIFFRFLLVIPADLLSYVFRIVNNIVAFLGWFVCIFTGRMPEGMRNLSAWLFRYEIQTFAYSMLLTGRYPSLQGAPTA